MIADSVMRRMVFVTGFARGGTSWLRDCIGSHPDVTILPGERVVFRDLEDPEEIRGYFQRETAEVNDSKSLIVNKAPANAPHIGRAAKLFPESRFIFIIRDPRDVLVSHQRGTKDWMKGANSTVEGCMSKTQRYFEGWLEAETLPNVLLVRYEDLHQDFLETMRRVYNFINVDSREDLLNEVFDKNNFTAKTKRANVEDRSDAKRRGVVGEWAQQLKKKEVNWYKKSPFFCEFMDGHGYGWKLNTYANIVRAMQDAGVHFLSEDDLLARRLHDERPNVVLQHDIDFLNKSWCYDSVKRTAKIEAELGLVAAYNVLPLDDSRYGDKKQKAVLKLIKKVRSINPRAYIGLHVNACERFYSASAPDAGITPPDLQDIRDYLRKQVQDYLDAGVTFRTATAHGYGRGKRLPNNCDTPEIETDLAEFGITLFDTAVRMDIRDKASQVSAITDVGGVLKARRLENGFELTDPRAFDALPAGSFLRFLTHPGNYPVDAPATLAMRAFSRPADYEG